MRISQATYKRSIPQTSYSVFVQRRERSGSKADVDEKPREPIFTVEVNQKQRMSFLGRVNEHGLDKAGNFGEPEFTYGK